MKSYFYENGKWVEYNSFDKDFVYGRIKPYYEQRGLIVIITEEDDGFHVGITL